MSCNTRMVPLYSVAKAAMVDTYQDISKAGVYQTYLHWSGRGLKKLSNEILKLGKQKAIIYINPNTRTGTLPPDCSGDDNDFLYIGLINDNGERVDIKVDTKLIDVANTQDLSECVDKCDKCNQNKAICNDLTVTEETEVKIIDGGTYTQTVTKKLYPNGDYYLESSIPVLNKTTDVVEYFIEKEFVAKIDLKACGCIEESASNIATIKACNPSVYCGYFAPCCNTTDGIGYQVFPESGLIKFNTDFNYNKAYIEYRGYLPKKNGVYLVPEIAFETLVEWVKWKAIDGRLSNSVSRFDKRDRYENYLRERRALNKIKGRFRLSQLLLTAMQLPVFEYTAPSISGCRSISAPVTTQVADSCSVSENSQSSSTTSSSSGGKKYVPYSISVIAGTGAGPVQDSYEYADTKLQGTLLGLEFIIVNNNIETEEAGQFYIEDGKLIRTNPWQTGDVLIVPTFFKYL